MALRSKIKAAFGAAKPTMIYTINGMVDEATLTKTEGVVNDYNEYTTWQEWRDANGQLVKREAQVSLKKGLSMPIHAGELGG